MTQSVGERIAQARREKAARERRDISQRDVAKAVHVSGASVSEWEADKTVPRDDTLAKLAKFLGVTPAYLRYGVREAIQQEQDGQIVAGRGMVAPKKKGRTA